MNLLCIKGLQVLHIAIARTIAFLAWKTKLHYIHAFSSFHPYYQALAWNKNQTQEPTPKSFCTSNPRPPPSPQGTLHRCLFTLSQKYRPIFSLQLGSRLSIVVSSPSAVEECFTKNDIIFASRPLFWAGKYVGYNYTNVGLAPYGDHWRNLRRIFRHEILSPNCLKLSSAIRMDEARILLKNLYNFVSSQDDSFVKVKLKPMLSEFTFNMISEWLQENNTILEKK
ncbi:isoflavone 3'-hydroxylase-like [Durio zibethinus]|uniref:Isoflavone 3'-hydroxylase-like n=1 Tax=Durio zibethinus TaxID=66656 RepID=A0A6P5Z5I8_DURZI|nr:isoflavone 3'-hydroxylase-like [Durio zibethinus]